MPKLVLLALSTLIASEIALRWITQVDGWGNRHIGRLYLLPYRPEAKTVLAWWNNLAHDGYIVPDSQLGWTIRMGGGQGHHRSNPQGIRTDPLRVINPDLPPDRLRIVAVGDSFTHGSMVLAESWHTQLETMRPDVEVVNFGVPGYGTDQALLRWRLNASAFKSHGAMLGIWPENVCRNLNVLRYYLAKAGFHPKPRFRLDDGQLVLVNSPTPEGLMLARALADPESSALLEHEYWHVPGDTAFRAYHYLYALRVADSFRAMAQARNKRTMLYDDVLPEGNAVTVAIAQEFAREAAGAGAEPFIVIFPMRDLLAKYPGDNDLPLASHLRAAGLTVVNMASTFAPLVAEHGRDRYFDSDGHLGPEGERLAAQILSQFIDSHFKAAAAGN